MIQDKTQPPPNYLSKQGKKITHPALKYYGAKWRISKIIIDHFPKHTSYVEVFGGGAGILIQKPVSKMETYNDKWDEVVNYFRMLRDRPAELINKIDLTPWARSEYELSRHERVSIQDDPIEAARRFWVGCQMSIQNMPFGNSGMRVVSKRYKGDFICRRPHSLWAIAKRLKMVQIENLDYKILLEKYEQAAPFTLFYFDPPYLKSTRSSGKVYAYEWDESEHITAAELLNKSQAYVIVSGYKSELYNKLYKGWHVVEFESQTNGNKGSATECLWLNPQTYQSIKKEKWGDFVEKKGTQVNLFD